MNGAAVEMFNDPTSEELPLSDMDPHAFFKDGGSYRTSPAISTMTALYPNTTSFMGIVLPDELRNVNTAFYTGFLPLSLLGNLYCISVVIVIAGHQPVRKSIPDILVGTLSCVELFSILTFHAMSIIAMVNAAWIFPPSMCALQSFSVCLYIALEFLVQAAISLDRYVALTTPFRYQRWGSAATVRLVICGIIALSVVLAVGLKVTSQRESRLLATWYLCTSPFDLYDVVSICVLVTVSLIFGSSFIIIIVCNLHLVRTLCAYNSLGVSNTVREVTEAIKSAPENPLTPLPLNIPLTPSMRKSICSMNIDFNDSSYMLTTPRKSSKVSGLPLSSALQYFSHRASNASHVNIGSDNPVISSDDEGVTYNFSSESCNEREPSVTLGHNSIDKCHKNVASEANHNNNLTANGHDCSIMITIEEASGDENSPKQTPSEGSIPKIEPIDEENNISKNSLEMNDMEDVNVNTTSDNSVNVNSDNGINVNINSASVTLDDINSVNINNAHVNSANVNSSNVGNGVVRNANGNSINPIFYLPEIMVDSEPPVIKVPEIMIESESPVIKIPEITIERELPNLQVPEIMIEIEPEDPSACGDSKLEDVYLSPLRMSSNECSGLLTPLSLMGRSPARSQLSANSLDPAMALRRASARSMSGAVSFRCPATQRPSHLSIPGQELEANPLIYMSYMQRQMAKVVRLMEKAANRQKREVVLARVVFVNACVFVITWLPFIVTTVLSWFRVPVPPVASDLSLKLVFSHAFINPVFHGLCRHNYRKGFLFITRMILHYLTIGYVKAPGEDLVFYESRRRKVKRHLQAAAQVRTDRGRRRRESALCVQALTHHISTHRLSVMSMLPGAPPPLSPNILLTPTPSRSRTASHSSSPALTDYAPSPKLQSMFEQYLEDTDSDSQLSSIDYDALDVRNNDELLRHLASSYVDLFDADLFAADEEDDVEGVDVDCDHRSALTLNVPTI